MCCMQILLQISQFVLQKEIHKIFATKWASDLLLVNRVLRVPFMCILLQSVADFQHRSCTSGLKLLPVIKRAHYCVLGSRNNLYNTNPGFDWGAFRTLMEEIWLSSKPEFSLLFQFREPGVYVMKHSNNQYKKMVRLSFPACSVTNNYFIFPSTDLGEGLFFERWALVPSCTILCYIQCDVLTTFCSRFLQNAFLLLCIFFLHSSPFWIIRFISMDFTFTIYICGPTNYVYIFFHCSFLYEK